MPSVTAEAKRRKRLLEELQQRQVAGRVRVDVRLDGEPMPAWPDVRPGRDFWLVIDLTPEGQA